MQLLNKFLFCLNFELDIQHYILHDDFKQKPGQMNDQFHRLFKRIPFSILYIQVLGLVYFFFLQCINFSFDEIQYTCPIWDC